ncbi:MAG: glycosyltransferase [Pirellulaceae bacterium]
MLNIQDSIISVITPAHNEEKFLSKCIESVKASADNVSADVEHIVVLNRCTDRTEEIATEAGCRIVREDARVLSTIRNAGAAAAQGDIIVTIDADSWMTPNMLPEVIRMLETGKYIGGGVRVQPERFSLGILCTFLVILPFCARHGVFSAGLFWCYKKDFDAIGGFDDSLICVEDVDFAKRLRLHGKTTGKKYGTIRKAKMLTSCRKFDEFGDWYFVRNPKVVYDVFKQNKAAANKIYYDFQNSLPRD